jgi:phage repressor protein C with HTH and peptisase S24 domain
MARGKPPAAERLQALAPGFGARVRAAADVIGNYREAADVAGMVYDMLRKIMNETNAPSFPAMAALAHKAGIRLDWLAFATGPQFVNETLSTRTSGSGAATSGAAAGADSEVIYLREYVPEGTGNVLLGSMPFPRRLLDRLQLAADDVALLEQSGDAMAPTIGNGDLMMLNLRRREISDGIVVAARVGGELMIKRLQREPDGGLQLLNDNPKYGSVKLLPESIGLLDVLGRVVWHAREI